MSNGPTQTVGQDRFVINDVKDNNEIFAVAEGEIVALALEEIVAVALEETVVDAVEDRVGNEERALGDVDAVALDEAEDDTVIEGVKLEDGDCDDFVLPVDVLDKVADREPVELAVIDEVVVEECVILDEAVDDEVGVTETEIVVESVALEEEEIEPLKLEVGDDENDAVGDGVEDNNDGMDDDLINSEIGIPLVCKIRLVHSGSPSSDCHNPRTAARIPLDIVEEGITYEMLLRRVQV